MQTSRIENSLTYRNTVTGTYTYMQLEISYFASEVTEKLSDKHVYFFGLIIRLFICRYLVTCAVSKPAAFKHYFPLIVECH